MKTNHNESVYIYVRKKWNNIYVKKNEDDEKEISFLVYITSETNLAIFHELKQHAIQLHSFWIL